MTETKLAAAMMAESDLISKRHRQEHRRNEAFICDTVPVGIAKDRRIDTVALLAAALSQS